MEYIRIDFELQDGEKISRLIPSLIDDVDDLKVPLMKAGEQVLHANRRTFESEGPGWAPLAPATVEQRLRLGYGGRHPILKRTGMLKASLTEKNAFGSRWEVGKDFVRIGSGLTVGGWNLAMLHQRGTRKMPARPIMDLDKWNLRRKISREFEVHLYHVVNAFEESYGE